MAADSAKQRVPLKSVTEIKASQSNVALQAKLLDSAGTAWHAVKYGNLEMITRLFPSQCNVYSKGPVGDNVFHIALLLNTPSTLAIAKYLVKLYGKTLVNTPYQERSNEDDPPGLYEGETALHIAIVNRDFDMVKFLIQAGAEIRARCYGAFFALGSPVYYGEYPLSFAAATGSKDIVSYLKRHGARVNQDYDQYGNTALHLAVVHDQLEMYDHLLEYCGASEHARNNRGATPLLLAATLGKLEVFQHIYNKRRRVAWAYGPVTSYSLSLHEIDTVQNSKKSFVPSAVETIIRKGHMHMIDDPLVKTLLTSKWQRFARVQFQVQAGVYLVLMLVQTFLVWLHSDPRYWNTYHRTALEVSSLILALGFLSLEVVDVTTWTVGVGHRRRLMKQSIPYNPPLYPIPGEVHETGHKTKEGFLQRMLKGHHGGGAAGGAGPVSEGLDEQQGVVPPGAGAEARCSDAHPHHHSHTITMQPGDWWQAAEAAATGQRAVGEGLQSNVTVKFSPTLDEGQSDYMVPTAEGGEQAASGVAPGPGAVQKGVSGRNASSAGASFGRQASRDVDVDAHRDIVSVGLNNTPFATHMVKSPSFFVQPIGTGKPGQEGNPVQGGGVSGASLPPGVSEIQGVGSGPPLQRDTGSQGPTRTSLQRTGRERDSIDSARSSTTEFKNRIRGGGGGDYQAGATSTRRSDPKAAPDREEEGQDMRPPLHVGGVQGQIKALTHSLAGYYTRQLQDPITLLMMCHIWLTLIHFITWATAYGGTGGSGPSNVRARQFDDIVLSLVALSGWTSLLYFARGVEYAGQLAVLVELCLLEVVKYCTIYFIFNIAYTLAFYTVLRGTTEVMSGASLSQGGLIPDFDNIGYGMIQLLRFMYGEAAYETYSSSAYQSKRAVATCYFILYILTVLLLLTNLLTAVVLHTYNAKQGHAQKVWLLRWSSYVLRAERRLPLFLQQRYRLGEVSYDPALQTRVYNHVFEVVEESDKSEERDKEIKVLEQLLDRMKKPTANKK